MIGTLPELQVLDTSERRLLLKKCVTWFVRAKLLILPIAAGILPLVGGVQLFILQRWPALALLAIAAGIFNVVWLYAFLIERIRSGIRDVLQDAAKHGENIICLTCGYDLSKCTTSTCPECGTTSGQ